MLAELFIDGQADGFQSLECSVVRALDIYCMMV